MTVCAREGESPVVHIAPYSDHADLGRTVSGGTIRPEAEPIATAATPDRSLHPALDQRTTTL